MKRAASPFRAHAAGWVRATVNPLDFRTSLTYNAAGWQTATIDANNNRTTTVFDATGRAVATVDALANRVTQVFDAAGRRTALVDARSNRYTFIWDATDRQIRQVDPLSRTITFRYDAASEQTLRIDARGNRTTYAFDNLSRPISRQYPDGSRVTMAYDAVSNRRYIADSTGRYTTLYDALNRARAVRNPANLTITYSFDAAGRRRTMIEPFGGVFTYGYSATDLNTLVINPQGECTTWQYDANSRVTVQQLANLVRVSYVYDDADRLIRLANLTSTSTTITSYVDAWDPAGNRLHRVEQDATRVTWSYDSTYQLTNEQRSGANSYNTTYGYDAAGNRRLKLDNSVRTTYSYDAANQLQKYVDNTGTTTFTFDASGNQRVEQTPSSGMTTNSWDYENRLTKVALPAGVLNTFAYNGDGLRVQRQDSSGTSKQIWDRQKIVEETDQNNVPEAVYTQSIGVYGDAVSQRRSGISRYFLFDPLGSTTRLADGSQNVTDSYLFKAFGEPLLAAGPTMNPFQFVGMLGYYLDGDLPASFLREREFIPTIARFLSVDPVGLAPDMNLFRYSSNDPVREVDPSGLRGPKTCPSPFTRIQTGPIPYPQPRPAPLILFKLIDILLPVEEELRCQDWCNHGGLTSCEIKASRAAHKCADLAVDRGQIPPGDLQAYDACERTNRLAFLQQCLNAAAACRTTVLCIFKQPTFRCIRCRPAPPPCDEWECGSTIRKCLRYSCPKRCRCAPILSPDFEKIERCDCV